MSFAYNFLIYSYGILIRFAAFFDDKAKLWINGRKNQKIPDLSSEKVVWMHCSSLGEFEQGRPVFEKLRQNRQDYKFVLTFFSPSGFNSLKNYQNADYVLYLPIDTPKNAEKFINDINPGISIFVKYDFWYNYLKTLNDSRRKVVFISVLLDKNHRLFSYFNKIILDQLARVTMIFTQDESTKMLLENRGFDNVEKAGDTRIDRVIEIANSEFSDTVIEKFISPTKKVLICGSTWQKDIDIFSEAKKLIIDNFKLIIAPHEVSGKQIDYISQKFSEYNIQKYSEQYDSTIGTADILIIDKIGILSKIYRYADIAYIGGGFGKSIHNTLEPAAYIIPVIFGPNYQKFTEASTLVSIKSFFSIKDKNQLEEILLSLNNKVFYNKVQNGIKEYLDNNKNAGLQIVKYLEKQML